MDRSRPHGKLAFVPLALFLSVAGSSAASSNPSRTSAPEALTPERAVALALENHPTLEAAERQIDAARAEGEIARSGWLPRIDLSEDWTRSTNPTFVFASKLGQERFSESDFAVDSLNRPDPLTNAATRVALRQNVWDAGRTRLGGRAASAGVEAATASLRRARDQVAFGALRAFWGAALAEEMLDVTRVAEKAASGNLEMARARADEGLAIPSDRMQAEVRLAEVRAMRARAEAGVATARAALREALGEREDRSYELARPAIDPQPPAEDAEALVAEALTRRGDLAALDGWRRQAVLGESLARSRRRPEIGLGAQYEWNAETVFGNDGSNWTVGAGVRLPLFDGLETRARVARARADRDRLDASRVAAEEGIRLEVRAAVAECGSASERLRAALSAIGLAEEASRIVNERYQEGLAVMVEVLGAEAALARARADGVTAAHDLALARAAVDFAVGREATGMRATTTEDGEAR